MERRQLLVTAGTMGTIVAGAGCLDDEGDETADVGDTDSTEGGSPAVQSTESTADGESENETGDESENEPEVECETVIETNTETIVENTREIEGGYEWTHEYRCEDDDEVTFDISASDGQDVEVEIDSPQGRTVYTESGRSFTTVHRFDTGGIGEVRVRNLGERTEQEREELWDDRVDVGAGGQLDPWVEVREGNSVEYYIRMVDGARPILRIEDEYGSVMREHSVAGVIDDTFTAPETGRYYFIMENTARITSGTWDYTFERVENVPIPTTATLTISREFEEETEVCE